jgi:diketogulonate reductase-like aldo/keto reductase
MWFGFPGYPQNQPPQTSTFNSVNHPIVIEIAKKYEKTPVQIILAWGLSRGYAVIPKAASEAQQRENFEALSIKLSQDEIQLIIEAMEKHHLSFFELNELGVSNIFA